MVVAVVVVVVVVMEEEEEEEEEGEEEEKKVVAAVLLRGMARFQRQRQSAVLPLYYIKYKEFTTMLGCT